MSVEFTWMDEAETIAYWNLINGWTWKDMNPAIQTMNDILAKSNRRIDIIVRFEHFNMIKANPFNHIREMAASCANTDPQVGSITLIGGGKVIEMVSDKLISLIPELGARIRFAESIEEAITGIHADRKTSYRAAV